MSASRNTPWIFAEPNCNNERLRDAGLLAMRLMLGFVFMYHGYGKIVSEHGVAGFATAIEGMNIPFPVLNAWMATLTELVGGALLILTGGRFFRLVTIPMIITMLVAGFVAHSGFSAQTGGGEYPLTLAVMLFALTLMGAGRWTATGLLFGRDD